MHIVIFFLNLWMCFCKLFFIYLRRYFCTILLYGYLSIALLLNLWRCLYAVFFITLWRHFCVYFFIHFWWCFYWIFILCFFNWRIIQIIIFFSWDYFETYLHIFLFQRGKYNFLYWLKDMCLCPLIHSFFSIENLTIFNDLKQISTIRAAYSLKKIIWINDSFFLPFWLKWSSIGWSIGFWTFRFWVILLLCSL